MGRLGEFQSNDTEMSAGKLNSRMAVGHELNRSIVRIASYSS